MPFPGKASCDRVALPDLRCMLGVLLFLANSDMDYRVFSVRTDANACGCTRGVRTPLECLHRKLAQRKIPCRTGESNLPNRRAGLTLYQLGYVPTPSILRITDHQYREFCKHARLCRVFATESSALNCKSRLATLRSHKLST